MEEFAAYIVKNLVADPQAVEIRSIPSESGDSIRLEIRVSPDDIGKIIGRRGNTIHALRTILRRVCARLKKKIQIDLVQPEGSIPIDSNNETSEHLFKEFRCCGGGCCSAPAQEEVFDDVEQEEEPSHSHHCGCHSHSE